MKPQLLRMGGGERITVSVSGDDYESCITEAMRRLSAFVVGARIVRDPEEAEPGDWSLDGSDCSVSPGGQTIGGSFTFTRAIPEEDEPF